MYKVQNDNAIRSCSFDERNQEDLSEEDKRILENEQEEKKKINRRQSQTKSISYPFSVIEKKRNRNPCLESGKKLKAKQEIRPQKKIWQKFSDTRERSADIVDRSLGPFDRRESEK